MLFSATIKGQLQSKANSRSLVTNRKTGRILFIKSKPARVWTDHAIIEMKRIWKNQPPYLDPVALMGVVYYQSKRSDLSIELLMDAIEKAGIIGNDRQVYEICFQKKFDKLNPRVEFTLIDELSQ